MPITATPYTKVLSVPDNRILGNNSGGTAAAIALTPAQVATMLALISDTAYNEATWNAVTDVAPSKNAVRDQFEVLSASISAAVSDTAYNATSWNGVTTIAPSKNAVRDAFQDGGVSPLFSGLTVTNAATIDGLHLGSNEGESVRLNNSADMLGLTTGTGWTAVGYGAGAATTSGSTWVAAGLWALSNNTTGDASVAVGVSAGTYQADGATPLTDADFGLYLGYMAKGFSNADNHAIVIGAEATGESATGIVIGSTYNSVSRFFGTPTYSDGTDSTKKLTLDMSGMGTGVNRTVYWSDDLVEFRRGTNPQVLRLDKTWTSATNFEALRIDASSSGPRIGSEVGSAGGTTRDLDFGWWDSAAVWTSAAAVTFGTSNTLTMTSDSVSAVAMYSHNVTNTNGSVLRGYRSRGTRSVPAAVTSADILFNLQAFGHDGTAWTSTARGQWQVRTSENWAAGSHGTEQVWGTTLNGAASVSSRMMLSNDGSLVIGASPTSATGGRLELNGTNNGVTTSAGATNRLRFTDTDTTTALNQPLGAIEFYSSDATAPGAGVKAYMVCAAESATPSVYFAIGLDTTTGTPSEVFRIASSGALTSTSSIKSTNATAGIGYDTGAGGTVTQATSKATGVTLNKTCGTITMNGAALAADTTVSFTVTNSACAATDVIAIQHDSAGTLGAYLVVANTPAAGSFQVSVRNVTAGSLSEAIVVRFAIIKAVIS